MTLKYRSASENPYGMNDFSLDNISSLRQGASKSQVSVGKDRKGKKVIVKTFTFNSNDKWSVKEQLDNEIEILSRLDYFAIPKLIDFFRDGNSYYLVREYFQAESLNSQAFYSEEIIIEISRQLLDTLIYLQQQNPPVIHHDIKPGNILWDGKRAYLIDFGIARILSEETIGLTEQFGGTDGFVAPEKFLGREASNQCDLYSLGVTIACLLSRTRAKNARQLINDDFELLPINNKYDSWLSKLTRRLPKDRYDSATTARFDLDRIINPLKEKEPFQIRLCRPFSRIDSISETDFWRDGFLYSENNNYYFRVGADSEVKFCFVLDGELDFNLVDKQKISVFAKEIVPLTTPVKYRNYDVFWGVNKIRRQDSLQLKYLRQTLLNRTFSSNEITRVIDFDLLFSLNNPPSVAHPLKPKDILNRLHVAGRIIDRVEDDYLFEFPILEVRGSIVNSKVLRRLKIVVDNVNFLESNINFWLVPACLQSLEEAIKWMKGRKITPKQVWHFYSNIGRFISR